MAKKKKAVGQFIYKRGLDSRLAGFLIMALILLLTTQFKFDSKTISPSFKWATDGQIASRIKRLE